MVEDKFQTKCDFCEKSFCNEDILGLHIKSNHKAIIEGWKKCDFCDKTYRLKNSLNAHMRLTHSKSIIEGLKKCDVCDKEFTLYAREKDT